MEQGENGRASTALLESGFREDLEIGLSCIPLERHRKTTFWSEVQEDESHSLFRAGIRVMQGTENLSCQGSNSAQPLTWTMMVSFTGQLD
jgi:hypothetical protein